MAKTDGVFKRCGCKDTLTGRRLDRACPRLAERGHGSWYFRCSASNALGGRERVRHGGYQSRAAAVRAREEWLARTVEERTAGSWTLERWLRYWLSAHTAIRPTTRSSHTGYIEQFLIPHLGKVRLAELTSRHLNAAFTEIGKTHNRFGRPHSPCTLAHVRATLRAALDAAVREGLIADNPARRVELPTRVRPHAVVWSRPRIAEWRATGARPAVAVWPAALLARFLTHVKTDRLFALWWLIALRGLRRGEAAGLRWADLDLDRAEMTIARARTSVGYQVHEGPPKSAAGTRTVALDKWTVAILRGHDQQQRAERAMAIAAGQRWHESGYVFTRTDGSPLHPDYLSHRFGKLAARHGLPPVRLHDLRHGAASLAYTAGAELKTVQDQLGHASIVITADVYTSVLPQTQHRAAAATARLVLDATAKLRGKLKRKRRRNRPDTP
ncbi:MAG TPA: tyrosine-type recombinase/integrase [Kribbellaceae bacterium]|nr:tyrosine-type recombinase/integrase [Kribbellaceae bacterium]